jgi:hypothetical protein
MLTVSKHACQARSIGICAAFRSMLAVFNPAFQARSMGI